MTVTSVAFTRDDVRPEDDIVKRFKDHIEGEAFVCVGAKAALSKGNLEVLVARDLKSAWNDVEIYQRLLGFAHSYAKEPELFRSFVVLFEQTGTLTERQFEQHLWERVQSLSDKDALHGQVYDRRVSQDPGNPHFGLSFGGEAFFVVGLHPAASRASRRFEVPALVFNLHDQFETLRNEGRYEKMRSVILARDVKTSGSLNPMLARHGETSEAKQYSGRSVSQDWECPFDPRQRNSYNAF